MAKRDAAEREKKIARVSGLVLAAGVLAGLAVMFMFGERPPLATVEDGALTIDGMYGLAVPPAEIEDIALLEERPAQLLPGRTCTNGYGGFWRHPEGTLQFRRAWPLYSVCRRRGRAHHPHFVEGR